MLICNSPTTDAFHLLCSLSLFVGWLAQEEAICLLCVIINLFPSSVGRHYDTVSSFSEFNFLVVNGVIFLKHLLDNLSSNVNGCFILGAFMLAN